jgi:hypothetical protein
MPATEALEPLNVSADAFPQDGGATDKLLFLLRYAVLAPSGHNTQPWLFAVHDETVEVYADRTQALPVVDPEDRELTMSCGAALLNLRIALRRFAYRDDAYELLPNPEEEDLLARIRLVEGNPPSPEEEALFEAIPKRRTTRAAYEPPEIAVDVQRQLERDAVGEGAWLHLTADSEREPVADLIVEGDRAQMADKRFRRELAAWVHPNVAFVGVAIALMGVGFFGLYRPWQLRWGATREDLDRTMPGDEVVPSPTFNATRAITIDATPEDIWPWLLQIGFGRAGWYSYDLLDNLGRHSAEHIVPELQHMEVGDLVPLGPGKDSGMRVKDFETGRYMVWWDSKLHLTTWTWLLDPLATGGHAICDAGASSLLVASRLDGDVDATAGGRGLPDDAEVPPGHQAPSRGTRCQTGWL